MVPIIRFVIPIWISADIAFMKDFEVRITSVNLSKN